MLEPNQNINNMRRASMLRNSLLYSLFVDTAWLMKVSIMCLLTVTIRQNYSEVWCSSLSSVENSVSSEDMILLETYVAQVRFDNDWVRK